MNSPPAPRGGIDLPTVTHTTAFHCLIPCLVSPPRGGSLGACCLSLGSALPPPPPPQIPEADTFSADEVLEAILRCDSISELYGPSGMFLGCFPQPSVLAANQAVKVRRMFPWMRLPPPPHSSLASRHRSGPSHPRQASLGDTLSALLQFLLLSGRACLNLGVLGSPVGLCQDGSYLVCTRCHLDAQRLPSHLCQEIFILHPLLQDVGFPVGKKPAKPSTGIKRIVVQARKSKSEQQVRA